MADGAEQRRHCSIIEFGYYHKTRGLFNEHSTTGRAVNGPPHNTILYLCRRRRQQYAKQHRRQDVHRRTPVSSE